MQRNWNGATEAVHPSRDSVLLVGQAPLPGSLRPYSASPLLSLEIEMDPQTGIARGILCHELSTAATFLLEELFLGKELESNWNDVIASLESRYFAPNRPALVQAVLSAQRQFLQWRQQREGEADRQPPAWAPRDREERARVSPGSDPLSAADATTPGSPSRKGSKHQLATALVTLLAHSRLLDAHEEAHRAGHPIPAEARRQAVQLYAVLQQILHSIQAEQGLLEPQIEPVAVPELLGKALQRCASLGRQVHLDQHLPPDLGPVRGDPLVLEEALVLLFDEIAAYARAAGAGVEIGAERRRSELQLTIALRRRGNEGPPEPIGGEEFGRAADPLEQMWEGGLGTLAARTLVEHQGGRLWMQDGFPQDHHILCLALPAHSVQEETEPHPGDLVGDLPITPKKSTRITAAWR